QNAGWQTAGTSQIAPPSSGFTVSTALSGGNTYLTLATGAYGVGQSLQSGTIVEQGYYVYTQGECLQAYGSVVHGDRISIPDAYVVSSALSAQGTLEVQDVSVDLQGRLWSGPSF